jgi:hypothetical protein
MHRATRDRKKAQPSDAAVNTAVHGLAELCRRDALGATVEQRLTKVRFELMDALAQTGL